MDRRARGAIESRPAVDKSSTVTMSGNEIEKQRKLTIGMDLGDRATRYCVLDEAGDVILERSVPTTKKGMEQVFAGTVCILRGSAGSSPNWDTK
jgi:hypothetical protein